MDRDAAAKLIASVGGTAAGLKQLQKDLPIKYQYMIPSDKAFLKDASYYRSEPAYIGRTPETLADYKLMKKEAR
jgi:hypothetical protein